MFGIGAVVFAVVMYNRQKARDLLHSEFEPIAEFSVGTYVLGLPAISSSQSGVRCMVTEDWFIFVNNRESPVDKVRRNAVSRVTVDIRSHMTQRLTATRILILIFAVTLKWLPPSGYGGIKYLILPALALGSRSIAFLARVTRSSMLEVLGSDFIRTAREKGLREGVVIGRHALRNALIRSSPCSVSTSGTISRDRFLPRRSSPGPVLVAMS